MTDVFCFDETDAHSLNSLNELLMKPYSEYSAEELAMENLFIRWVRFPDDPPIRSFWENWMVKYPTKKDTIEKARELVLITSEWKPETLSNQDVNSLWDRIRTSLEIIKEREPGDDQQEPLPEILKSNNILLGLISMALLGILCFIFLFFIR